MLDQPTISPRGRLQNRPRLDFQEHLAALEANGLLVRIDRPSTRIPSCIRWCAGSSSAASPEDERRAFLFTNVVDSKGRRYDIPVAVGALAASPRIYALGMGQPVEEIGRGLARAIAHPIPPIWRQCAAAARRWCSRARHLRGPDGGLDAPAGAGVDAGLRFRALSHGDAVRHPRSRQRHPEHGHLSRSAEGIGPARGAHGGASTRAAPAAICTGSSTASARSRCRSRS